MKELKISSEDMRALDALKEASPASILLLCANTSHEALDHIFNALKDHGQAVAKLEVSLVFPSTPFEYKLQDFDFAQYCPNLVELQLGRCEVGESVLTHPKLQLLVLNEGWLYTQDPFELGVKEESFLKELVLNDTNWGNEERKSIQLIIGSKSHLKRFSYSLDEDYASACTHAIEIKDAPHLEELYGNICATWEVIYKGSLPSLKRVYGTGGQYGRAKFDFSQIADDSSAYAIKIRDVQNPKKDS